MLTHLYRTAAVAVPAVCNAHMCVSFPFRFPYYTPSHTLHTHVHRHEDGLNYNRILPDLIVGSCLQVGRRAVGLHRGLWTHARS